MTFFLLNFKVVDAHDFSECMLMIYVFYIFFCRSVVVVCKNMNATDVERLVPRLALPGCNPKHPRSRRVQQSRQQYTGRCIEVNQQNQTASELDTSCRGETDLCQSLDNQKGCSNQENDVLCRLMHKVRHYLRTRYNVTEEDDDEDSPPNAVAASLRPRRKLLRPNPTRAMPKVIVILVVAEMQLFTKKERVPHRCKQRAS